MMWFGFQVLAAGSQMSRYCQAQWIDLKTPVNQVSCGTECLEEVLAPAVAKLELVTLCTLTVLEREKHEPFLLIFDTSSKLFTILTVLCVMLRFCQGGYVLPWFVGLSVCQQDYSKSYGLIFPKN